MIESGQFFVDLTQQGISAWHVCMDATIAKLLMNLIGTYTWKSSSLKAMFLSEISDYWHRV